ncbi:exodeoxyribonuclease VII large subunit [Paraferrimonas sedimenticola]|uniref:Exodeoxyribonuclease 7 large subunit n=1 Tax=Paraferrimonas sedimenticola TaxID=375674 RepID=A0AA37W089_9GAMM|nr:exodeoxyribonuclease VII large subunit [Paraferrimonas sedimenticola]GLP95158.1 exodeoxyribonuclease 7 large subunit [Paraferrimonas sedimenticola]
MSAQRPPLLSVSQLNRQVRQLLESQIGRIWLTGEISNFAAPASGHWYFSLKDSQAQVRCAMFKGRNSRVAFTPKNGQQVTVQADISLYEPRGDYQLIVGNMVDSGEGRLKAEFEKLKLKLAGEGLFAQEHKQPLPRPHTLGVITSASGAAIRDVLHVLERRAPSMRVIIYPASVQGELAPAQLISAIETANARNEVDALLLTRGGGSLEDLWSFNDEGLARAIFTSKLPIISAVGHEVDITIADFVADVRAPTPSAGAEMLSGDQAAQVQQLTGLRQRLQQSILGRLNLHQQALLQYQYRLDAVHPERALNQIGQQFDELGLRLTHAMQRRLDSQQAQTTQLQHRLMQRHPGQDIALAQTRLAQLGPRLGQAMRTQLNSQRQQWQSMAAQLQAISPLATLERGYAIARDEQGQPVSSVSQVQPGQGLSVQLHDGRLETEIKAVKAD